MPKTPQRESRVLEKPISSPSQRQFFKNEKKPEYKENQEENVDGRGFVGFYIIKTDG
jgi:hypothetical protein